MRILLDTHVLIWAVAEPERLPSDASTRLRDRTVEVHFSAVNVWETAMKFALGRPDFQVEPNALVRRALEADFSELVMTSRAAARVATLPRHHRDPFDRLLVAQAIDADAVLLTADIQLAAYAPHVLMIA